MGMVNGFANGIGIRKQVPGPFEALQRSGEMPLDVRVLTGGWGEVDEHGRLETEFSLEQGSG